MTWDLVLTGELPTEARAAEEAQAATDRQPDRHTGQAEADQRALRLWRVEKAARAKAAALGVVKTRRLADTALDMTPKEHRRHGEKPTLFREMVRRDMRR
jgi:hypothetical protein